MTADASRELRSCVRAHRLIATLTTKDKGFQGKMLICRELHICKRQRWILAVSPLSNRRCGLHFYRCEKAGSVIFAMDFVVSSLIDAFTMRS
jgi:hypothetical protein